MRSTHLAFRLALAIVVVAMVVAGLAPLTTSRAAVEPDTFYGSWPFAAPPKGHLNSFVPSAVVGTGGIGVWADLIESPLAFYVWATDEWKPLLAKKWGFSSDSKKYVVELRDDITWSDGSKVTAKDVVATYDIGRLRNFAQFTYVDSVVAANETTVEFNLSQPSTIVERLILKEGVRAAATYSAIADKVSKVYADGVKAGKKMSDLATTDEWKALSKEITDFRPTKVLASGPYTVDLKDVTDAQLVMRRNDKSAFKGAKFAKVVLFNGDTEVVTPLVQNGEVFYATDYFPPATEKSFTDRGIKILRAPTDSGPAIFFNNSIYPLGRVEVHQAIAYALDRQRIVKVSYGNAGSPVKYMAGIADALLPIWLDEAALKGLNGYAYDPKKAEEILTKAGFKKNGAVWVDDKGKNLEFELSVPSDFTDWLPVAQDATEQLTAFGIKTTLRGIPNAQHVEEVKTGKFQMAIRLWGFPRPHPWYAYRNMFIVNAVNKLPTDPGMSYPTKQKIGDKEVDFEALIAAMGGGTDVKAQKKAVTDAATAFNQLMPVVPLVERIYNSPLVVAGLEGLPAESDPVYQNNQGGDNPIAWWIIQGTIGPKKK